MFEKTLRYPGHAARMQILRDCGLMSEQPIAVGDCSLAPRDLLATVLEAPLRLGPEGDILVMRVIVEGRADSKPVVHTYELIDYFDPSTHHTAMARTTGYPAAYAARLIAQGDLDKKGVVFPEQLFIGDRFEALTAALAKKGITISHSVGVRY
jgi:lysine 6-dehydrogenase